MFLSKSTELFLFVEFGNHFDVWQHVKESERKIAQTQLRNTTCRYLRASSWTFNPLPENSRRYISISFPNFKSKVCYQDLFSNELGVE